MENRQARQAGTRGLYLDGVRFSVQRDRPTCGLDSDELQRGRAAAGTTICRTPERRGRHHRAGGTVRRSASVEGQAAGFAMMAIDPAIRGLCAFSLALIFSASGAMKLRDVELFEGSLANYQLTPRW